MKKTTFVKLVAATTVATITLLTKPKKAK